MENQIIKPCPFCGKTDVWFDWYLNTLICKCKHCGAAGPIAESMFWKDDRELLAITGWNIRHDSNSGS